MIVVVDPFMKRVHNSVPQSGEIVMVDATSNLDRNDTKLFHLMCPSTIGALPLAEMITTREDEFTIKFGLEMMKAVLPPGAFYGRGRDIGPEVLMTDDCLAERNALSSAWPGAVLLLCIFHVLQAVWTWLWDGKHKIAAPHRSHLIALFRQVVYAETEEELMIKLENMQADSVYQMYPQFQEHMMKDTLPKIKSWSISRRVADNLPTSNQNTNNLVESSFKYTKDIQFNRLRAFNLVDMLSLVLDKSEFYAHKCVDAGNNVIKSWLRNCHSRYVIKTPNIDPDKIEEISPDCYTVPSETDEGVTYLVDVRSRTCSCHQGRLRGPCKHKQILSESKNILSFDVIPEASPEMRKLYMFLGTGKWMNIDYFLPLESLTSIQDINDNVHVQAATVVLTPDNISNHRDTFAAPQDDHETSEERSNDIKSKLARVLRTLEKKIGDRVDQDATGYSKAIDIFEKSINRLPQTSDSALQKTLCAFGKTVTQAYNSSKRKKIGLIPIQSTSKARRLYKMRGRSKAVTGRPRSGQKLISQMVVADDDEGLDSGIVRYKLPGGKASKRATDHNLKLSVEKNKRSRK